MFTIFEKLLRLLAAFIDGLLGWAAGELYKLIVQIANVDIFGNYLKEYDNKTQFIVITHKKRTMEYAGSLYGITMQESGVSKLVSVKLD